ncbi:MAG: dihydropteroate synthase [Phycisphaerales bacterium]
MPPPNPAPPHTSPPPATHLRIAHQRALPLQRPLIMGILNITPDSFSDAGRHLQPDHALDRALQLIDEGADILDIGGESTRPGAQPVDPQQQIQRVIPTIQSLRARSITIPISIDTTSAQVARAAIDAGADIINDVSAATDDQHMLALAAATGAAIILMHRRTPPPADRYSHQHTAPPDYESLLTPHLLQLARTHNIDPVIPAVAEHLRQRAAEAHAAGIPQDSIVLDPGLGFGKSIHQNLALIAAMPHPAPLGLAGITAAPAHNALPLLGAASRKSFLGAIAGIEHPDHRGAPSIAAALAMAAAGVQLLRVHDVAHTRQALATWHAIHPIRPTTL